MQHAAAAALAARVRGGRGRGLGDMRRETVEAGAAKARAAARRRAAGIEDKPAGDADDEQDAPDVAHDPDAPLFADTPYDDDDREADSVYSAVDDRMRSRRQKHTEARIQSDLQQYRDANPTIPQQFADLKRTLSRVSDDDWATLPEVGDRSVQRRKLEKFTPAPDSLLQSAVAPTHAPSVVAGHLSTDFASISEGKSSVIGHKLDTAGDSVSGLTNIDPTGYLTEMAGMRITSDSEVSDVKKARALLRSVTTTNPKHAPGWIAAARLEEVAGKLSAARALAAEACHHCPTQEDVWLEAARLHPPEQAKRVLANAVRHVPKSVKVWLHAAAIEHDPRLKKRVLRKSLQVIPGSAKLWRVLVDLEDPEAARTLLTRAVECVPTEVDLWLGLARLESHVNAKAVLNRALVHHRAEPSVWITGAKLEEAHATSSENTGVPAHTSADTRNAAALSANVSGVDAVVVPTPVTRLISRAVQTLSNDDSIVKRERWLSEARDAETAGYPATCHALVAAALGIGVDDVDRKRVWHDDAAAATDVACYETARAIYGRIVSSFPGDVSVWRTFAEFESRFGSRKQLGCVLESGVACCPRAEVLWLMSAKDRWTCDGAASARKVLTRAFQANPESEAILLAAAKVEIEVGEYARARSLFAKARSSTPSARVYMKSAILERQTRSQRAQLELLDEGVEKFPSSPKLWLMLAQLHEQMPVNAGSPLREGQQCGDPVARAVYADGLRECPNCVPLWCGISRLEERNGMITKARAILERGRKACRGEDDVDKLWAESVTLEVRAGGVSSAGQSMLSRGLKECAASGRLWGLAISMEPRAQQRARSVDALKRCDQNAYVMMEVAKLFWRERKVEKARDWLHRAVKTDAELGDAWALLFAFESVHGSESKRTEVADQVRAVSPKYGDVWPAIRKRPGNEGVDVVGVLRMAAEQVSASLL
jgi:pre-mRNA-processing factor 6